MGYLIFAIAAFVLIGQALKTFAAHVQTLFDQHPNLEAIWTAFWACAAQPITAPLGLIIAVTVFICLKHHGLSKREGALRRLNFELEARAAGFAREAARLEELVRRRDQDDEARRERARRADPRVPENQERWLELHGLRTKDLLNGAEKRIHRIGSECLRGTGYRILAQASMGQFIGTIGEGRTADLLHSTYNSKRVDLLVCRADWRPRLIIEHMGSGHWLSDDAEHRDRLKRNAATAAGIDMIETFDHDTDAEIARRISAALSLSPRDRANARAS
jgi:hypothetical protein